MEAVTGALLAAGVAWASILAARRLPLERAFGENGLRLLAAASLAVIGLHLVGVPVGAWGVGAVVALAAGLALRRRARTTSPTL